MFSTLSGPMVDILIGLTFIYASLSLILSALGDCLSNTLGWRSGMFQAGIDAMLRPNDVRPPSAPAKLFRWLRILFMPGGTIARGVRTVFARIRGAAPPAAPEVDPWLPVLEQISVAHGARELVRMFLDHPACQSYRRNSGFLSFFGRGQVSRIPSTLFPKVLLECLMAGMNRSAPITPIDFRRALDRIDDPDLVSLLRTVTEGRSGSTAEIEDALKDHYESVMSQVGDWYARKMSVVLFGMGLVVAVAFNIDTIEFIKQGWNDPARAKAIAATAAAKSGDLRDAVEHLEAITKIDPRDVKDADPKRQEAMRKTISDANALLGQLKPQFPAGWTLPSTGELNDPKKVVERFVSQIRQHLTEWRGHPVRVLMRWLGLIITAVAISMQSRFWYDLLQRLLKIRNEPDPRTSP